MPRRFQHDRCTACALALAVACVALCGHAWAQAAAAAPSVVEPGAPGHPNKLLTPQTTGLHQLPPTLADIRFMQGMIMHHGQAVEMCELVKTHTTDPRVLELGRRIGLSQATEMAFMTKWLTDRGQPIDDPDMKMDGMAGMEMGDMKGMDMDGMEMDTPPMPGMLTRKQMDALRHARGPAFDRLFLTGMMQHHGGALTMVRDLFNQPSAVQDPALFDFATDVDNTQTAEIDLMHRLLVQMKLQ
jgi:uncharacterized protein (DUF305 family)